MKKRVTAKAVLRVAHTMLKEAQGDSDKADTVSDSEYYQGGADYLMGLIDHFSEWVKN